MPLPWSGPESRVPRMTGGMDSQPARVAADEGVAAAEVGVEERQGLAGGGGGQPQGDLGEFDGHGIEVDAVDAALDDEPPVGGAFLVVELVVDVFPGAGEGLAVCLGEPVDGGDEEPS